MLYSRFYEIGKLKNFTLFDRAQNISGNQKVLLRTCKYGFENTNFIPWIYRKF